MKVPSRAEPGHFNFRAENKLTILKICRAELKIFQLELWLEPARLGIIAIIYLPITPVKIRVYLFKESKLLMTDQGDNRGEIMKCCVLHYKISGSKPASTLTLNTTEKVYALTKGQKLSKMFVGFKPPK